MKYWNVTLSTCSRKPVRTRKTKGQRRKRRRTSSSTTTTTIYFIFKRFNHYLVYDSAEILHTHFILHGSLISKPSIALFYETLHKNWPKKKKKAQQKEERGCLILTLGSYHLLSTFLHLMTWIKQNNACVIKSFSWVIQHTQTFHCDPCGITNLDSPYP